MVFNSSLKLSGKASRQESGATEEDGVLEISGGLCRF